MTFTQIEFFIFLAFFLIFINISKNIAFRKFVLLAANLYFYSYFDFRLMFFIFIISFFTYFAGYLTYYCNSTFNRKLFFVFGLLLNLSFLAYFKYINFFISNLSFLLFFNHSSNFKFFDTILPLGISFFTFRFISYLIDIRRNMIQPFKLLDFMVYATFFPIIASGPISRANIFIPQINKIGTSRINLYNGFRLLVIGLFLKVFIADRISLYVNYFFDNYLVFNTLTSWIAILSYSLQIYFDFAGYSDMAIGISLMFGINVENNFDFPYLSKSIIEFWRKWHITLSSWIKDYLYIPLGGSRKGNRRKYFNLLIAMTLCGFWHGASWTFIFWGFLHGQMLLMNHWWKNSKYRSFIDSNSKSFSILSLFFTFLFVTISWIFFRSEDILQAMGILRKLFIFDTNGISWLQPFTISILMLTMLFHFLRYCNVNYFDLSIDKKGTLTYLLCMIWLVIVFKPADFQPFIYFQF